MDAEAITEYITDTFPGVEVVAASGDSFFFYDPDRTDPANQRFPFATLVTGDRYDQFSNLNRPGVFRLNIGVGKHTYGSLFGTQPAGTEAGYDFTALDRIMPHPVYGKMYWVCVLNPSEATFQAVRPLLAEAYDSAVSKYSKRAAQG